ncbi:MAG: DUF2605 domain-containing protein [Leptolyngbya sp. SIO1D8]|nr:DUF2605 domain-containing protein [Leptolyngbya sp. SIO1D8]
MAVMFFPEPSNVPEQPLVQTILEPLLDNFQYWFNEATVLLTAPESNCLDVDNRRTLIERIRVAEKEVATVRVLLAATDGQAGIEPLMVRDWHHLVAQYWQVARQVRQTNYSIQPGDDST